MVWTNVLELAGARCCSARGSANVNIPAKAASGDITVGSGALMKKIPLNTWQNRNDTALFTFSNNGIKIAESGNYLVSASISFTNGGTGDNHGVYVIDSNSVELMGAHYFNGYGATSNGCGCAPKIIPIAANTVLYLASYSPNSGTPIAQAGNEATFLTIVKLS